MTSPAGAEALLQTTEEVPLEITLADAGYTVTSSPQHGVLTGTAPNLLYTPTQDYEGLDSFQVQAADGAQADIALSISGVNDPPVLTQNYTDSVNYTRDQVPGVYILRGATDPNPLATLTDADSPDFDGGTLNVQTTAGGHAGDRIVVSGKFSIAGTELRYGTTLIGSVGSNGTGGANFTVTFNTSATRAIVEELANSLRYFTIGGKPGSRSIAFTVSDGDGGTSNTVTRTLIVWPSSFAVSYDGNSANQFPAKVFDFAAPLNLSEVDGIGLDVYNPSDVVARIGVSFQSGSSQNAHVLLQNIQPHSHARLGASFKTALKVFGLPFTESDVKWMDSLQTKANLANITRISLFLDRPTAAVDLQVSDVRTLQHIPLDTPLIDELGQYTRDDWDGKAHSQAELDQMIQDDVAQRQTMQPEANRDTYGGITNSGIDFGGAVPAGGTGNFTTAQDVTGRWWLVTPLGNPFYLVGVNSAQPYSGSPISFRSSLFEPVSPLSDSGGYDYYQANIQHYNDVEGPGSSWDQRTIDRLLGWGFNAIGNWPQGTLTQPVAGSPRIPYTRTVLQERLRLMPQTRFDGGELQPTLDFPGTNYEVPVFYTDGGRYAFPDVFSQPFLNYVLQDTVNSPTGTIPGFFGTPEVAQTNADPWAIGFFVDNEIRWAGGERDEKMALPRSALNMTGSELRTRFLEELASKYSSAASLASAWGITFSGLADLSKPLTQIGDALFVFPTNLNATAQADLEDLLGVYAEQYYKTVHDGFKAHMPNKLYLGSRLYEGDAPQSVLQALGHYADVISLNLYRKPEDVAATDWNKFAALNKPLLIGEFGYIATDEGNFTGFHQNRDVATQEDRGALYQQYMDLIANNPLFVGASVFSYVDEIATGRGGGFENFNVGLVDVLDLPHENYVDRVADWNHEKYATRLGADPVNHAPVLDPAVAVVMSPMQEDDDASFGTPVRNLLTSTTDSDPVAERGIAITSLGNTDKGAWQYTLDGGKTWFDFGVVSSTSARLLPASDELSRIRFIPKANFNGSVSLTFKAWDQTQGYQARTFDLSTAGAPASSAFSAAAATATLAVTPVNDAPQPDITVTPALSTIGKNNVNSYGTQVWKIMAGVGEADLGAKKGMAVTSLTGTTSGTWQYTLNGGATWLNFGSVSITSAVLLPADAELSRIRFQPIPSFSGTVKIGYIAWDQSSGAAGNRVDLSDANDLGGITAFSAKRRESGLTVNNAPKLDPNIKPAPPGVIQGNSNPYGFSLGKIMAGITDDVADRRGLAILSLTGKINGAWQYTLDGGAHWLDLETTSPSAARLLPVNGENTRIRFVPNPNFVGTAQIEYRAWDQTQGVAGQTYDLTGDGKTGGFTAFSANSRSSTLNVVPPNRAPVLDATFTPSLGTLLEDVPVSENQGQLVSSLVGGVTDPDGGGAQGIAVFSLSGKVNGAWQFSIDAGATWTSLGDVTESASRVLALDNRVRYLPNQNFAGQASLYFRAWDRSDNKVPGSVVNTVGLHGGTYAYSAASDSAAITITPVNDAPRLVATSPTMPSVPKNASAGSIAGVLVSDLMGGVTDPDGAAATKGIAVFSLSAKVNGSWQFSLDGGGTWSAFGDPTESASRVLLASNKVRFVPNANFVGTAKLYFRAWDQSDGLDAGSIVSTVGKKGGTNPFSTGTDIATVSVT